MDSTVAMHKAALNIETVVVEGHEGRTSLKTHVGADVVRRGLDTVAVKHESEPGQEVQIEGGLHLHSTAVTQSSITNDVGVNTDTGEQVVGERLNTTETQPRPLNTGTVVWQPERELGAIMTNSVTEDTGDMKKVVVGKLEGERTHTVEVQPAGRGFSRTPVTHGMKVDTVTEAYLVEGGLSLSKNQEISVKADTGEQVSESELNSARTHEDVAKRGLIQTSVTHETSVDTIIEAYGVETRLSSPIIHGTAVNSDGMELVSEGEMNTARTHIDVVNTDTRAHVLKRGFDATEAHKKVNEGKVVGRPAATQEAAADTGAEVVESPLNTARTHEDESGNTGTKTGVLHGSRRVVYVWSHQMVKTCDLLPRVPGRASRVHGLIEAYGLLPLMRVLPPVDCGKGHLTSFHSQEYVDFLESINYEEDSEKNMESKEEFGISCDCPPVPGVFDITKMVAGGTLRGVEALMSGGCQVAINWTGGWHHGRRDEAAGFCYVNDVVLALLKLSEKFKRILYVDIDLHHGDAVQDAFAFTSTVMTVSFHKYSPGFYPGTGSLGEVGHGRGRYHNVNVPLEDGVTDALYYTVFRRVMDEVYRAYQPSVVVMQCGADTLAGDSMNCFNLTLEGLGDCVNHVLEFGLLTLLLGGGGYNMPNTARCWAHLTAVTLGVRLEREIPDHEFFLEYGPDYQLDVTPSNRANMNTRGELARVVQTVVDNLQNIPPVTVDR